MIGLFLFGGISLSVVLFFYLLGALAAALEAFLKKHNNIQKDD